MLFAIFQLFIVFQRKIKKNPQGLHSVACSTVSRYRLLSTISL